MNISFLLQSAIPLSLQFVYSGTSLSIQL